MSRGRHLHQTGVISSALFSLITLAAVAVQAVQIRRAGSLENTRPVIPSRGKRRLAGTLVLSLLPLLIVTVDQAGAQTCPCSIWNNAALPQVIEQDPNAVEVGVRFRADVAGVITGLRFYKGAQNTGPHVGHLWTNTGQLLASVTFANETASGWQQVALPSPVAIAAHTTYVASYHTPVGFYALTEPGFTAEVANPPLRALADGADGPNGVYRYGASGFPTDTFNASNYWVDIVFSPSDTPPTPPSDALSLFVEPLTPLGQPSLPNIEAYDSAQLSFGRQYAESWPSAGGDLVSSNFYDLAYTLYQIYYRTQDPYWLTKARTVAQAWRDQRNIQSLHTCIESVPFSWDNCSAIMAADDMAMMGLTVLAAENHDPEAKVLLNLYAQFIRLKTDEDYWDDPRENGYKLMYLSAAVALGYDHRALAKTLLDTILAAQWADGAFPQGYPTGYPLPENFMQGLLMEGLVLYDRVIGDARIVPAMQQLTAWLWANQWLAADQAFRYAPPESSPPLGTGPAFVLNGLFLPGWGYLYSQTGDVRYRDQGNQIFNGLVTHGMEGEIWGVKQFNQVFRSSGHYLGAIDAP